MIASTETEYWNVHMGPKPGLPAWHVLTQPSRTPFPTLEAATRFAKAHKQIDPTRDIVIEYPDGRKWNGKEWV
ncbi:hypothetical protein SEA_GEMMA_71 [Mycobacterium phage Gemma]|uniref:DUF2188 domain-containing protein n=1 Tax=Mycobacterium phage PurpleHaze TaxID=1983577 RepID=A0A220NRX1_9CAUD|nr:hypothetical protein KIJ57_gp20 [Mycobacterium phage Purple Haze]AVJ50815.1 hypothetical protein SEA_OLANP_72 [Mycobacterium phage OlanP]AXH44698.1 hypothetical protein SEA_PHISHRPHRIENDS_70 [Mycobacterium phage PhishRPhriends]QAY02997.1 hypothetical protein SEA_GEMMA_71 [Mycobacterium phage Gemma]QBP32367.1 hypothetical protein SEA_HELIOSOLES_71 [Mycobacterium phage Heliosoles]QNL29919.1 hypothetical protein SEA_MANU_73 [Mycobacterium phage Manu]UAW08728.1 hypothetical protein SEA_HAVEUME